MEEEKYYQILSEYRAGVEFDLRTDRGNGVMEHEVRLAYVDEKTPQLKFKNGGAIFNPESIGGIKNIVSLNAKLDY